MNSPATPDKAGATALPTEPDHTVDVRDTFGIDIDWQVPALARLVSQVLSLPLPEPRPSFDHRVRGCALVSRP